MSNAELLLRRLDELLDANVDLTLYGRAALLLGYPDPKREYALSLDVDVVLWIGQAEELQRSGNFREARLPDSEEVREQVDLCRSWLVRQGWCSHCVGGE